MLKCQWVLLIIVKYSSIDVATEHGQSEEGRDIDEGGGERRPTRIEENVENVSEYH